MRHRPRFWRSGLEVTRARSLSWLDRVQIQTVSLHGTLRKTSSLNPLILVSREKFSGIPMESATLQRDKKFIWQTKEWLSSATMWKILTKKEPFNQGSGTTTVTGSTETSIAGYIWMSSLLFHTVIWLLWSRTRSMVKMKTINNKTTCSIWSSIITLSTGEPRLQIVKLSRKTTSF